MDDVDGASIVHIVCGILVIINLLEGSSFDSDTSLLSSVAVKQHRFFINVESCCSSSQGETRHCFTHWTSFSVSLFGLPCVAYLLTVNRPLFSELKLHKWSCFPSFVVPF